MSTPETAQNKNDAMNDWVGIFIQKHIRQNYGTDQDILDVGAGWGKYHFLLPEYVMDACEVWTPYVNDNDLHSLYREVFECDICDLKFNHYGILIFGDVFEHISRERAKILLNDIWDRCDQMYIAVPFQYPQGAVGGNPYEIHQQPDLTEQVMAAEYPMLKLLKTKDNRGVYVKCV